MTEGIDAELKPAVAAVGWLIAVLLLATFTAMAPAIGLPWWAGTLAAGWLMAGLMVRNLRKTRAEALRRTQGRHQ